MTDPVDNENIPGPRRTKRKRWLPSLIWLVPIVALLVGATLMARVILARGAQVTVTFSSAEGIEAGKTRVKYKSVDIGVVKAVGLTEDRSGAVVLIELTHDGKAFAASDTRFWVVRPRVAAGSISGLGTLLSGAYIGVDGGRSQEKKSTFKGLDTPPAISADAPGKQFTLHAPDLGSLDIGAPVYFRRVRVGQVTAYDIDTDGKGVTLHIFVNAPFDKFVARGTRFWNASGIDLKLDASGLKVDTQSLLTVALGGIAFQTPEEADHAPAASDAEFPLVRNETMALKDPEHLSQTVVMYFHRSLRGLNVGAPVEFKGINVGEIKSIGIHYSKKRHEFVLPVTATLYPTRFGMDIRDDNPQHAAEDVRTQFDVLVKNGMRAQLKSASLLTGQQFVNLDFIDSADRDKTPPRFGMRERDGAYVFPTADNPTDDIEEQIAGIAKKLNKVPFEQIGQDVHRTLTTLDATLKQTEQLAKTVNSDLAPQMKETLAEARRTLDSARQVFSDDAPLQRNARDTLEQVAKAAASVRVLTDYLDRHPEALIRGKAKDAQ
ncbi:intermembrane transport protein PqiB [Ralstonia sp. 22086]|uniref:PqiB family protein n=1 Tax=Ralstonia TaxID=48736 RepID=UPI001E3ECF82|nr:intermembrane transport protein PqiB [Ralstonia wenshanensis]MDY7509185.1 intermembrane transport protein PqiB [Ralstonia wenshanensis]UGS91579.1 intermembrane transport protein PqiB [Ralstonia wenshanensis]